MRFRSALLASSHSIGFDKQLSRSIYNVNHPGSSIARTKDAGHSIWTLSESPPSHWQGVAPEEPDAANHCRLAGHFSV